MSVTEPGLQPLSSSLVWNCTREWESRDPPPLPLEPDPDESQGCEESVPAEKGFSRFASPSLDTLTSGTLSLDADGTVAFSGPA
jgi:hypothetical protein